MVLIKELKKQIIKLINQEIKSDLSSDDLVYPPKNISGDISFPCFSLSKILQDNPNSIANDLSKKLLNREEIKNSFEKIEVAGPYINFFFKKEKIIQNTLEKIQEKKKKFGTNKKLESKRIMVEYAHPNPFKAFHIGHLRGTILGGAICSLLESQGAEVIRVNYQGDVGMHIAKCLWALMQIDKKDYPENIDEKIKLITKSYAKGATAFKDNEKIQKEIREINKKIYSRVDEEVNQIWDLGKKWSMDKFHKIFDRLGVWFEREYMESEVLDLAQQKIEEGIKKGVFVESKGAIVLPGEKHDVDTRVFLNSEKLPTYEGKEMGLCYMEFSDFGKIDLCIHNVAVEQISFFRTTFKAQELLDPEIFKGKQHHNVYEFVGLKKGKMSSRTGDVILCEDILNEAVLKIKDLIKDRDLNQKDELAEKIGIGSVKYSFLKISPKKYLAFDLDESVNFEGDSAPYIQYSYTRIKSILDRNKFSFEVQKIDAKKLSEKIEYDLVLKLSKYEEILEIATKNYDPSELCKYCFELAKQFNDYYHQVNISNAEFSIKEQRLILIYSISIVIENIFSLLGIDLVSEM